MNIEKEDVKTLRIKYMREIKAYVNDIIYLQDNYDFANSLDELKEIRDKLCDVFFKIKFKK